MTTQSPYFAYSQPAPGTGVMRRWVGIAALLCAWCLSTGCGSKVGDSCVFDSDCSPSGDQICTRDFPDGYCTVFGCDYNTCPDDAVCVRFFALSETNRVCTIGEDCPRDEFCDLGGHCVPRFSEVRYCMQTCDNNGDCREQYECRDKELMIRHGGEPIPRPGELLGANPRAFCAVDPDPEAAR